MERTGTQMIAEERLRQINEEGWTAEHDKQYTNKELYWAAMSYTVNDEYISKKMWPWDPKWWKPKDRVRDLIRAGALYQAQYDLTGDDISLWSIGVVAKRIEFYISQEIKEPEMKLIGHLNKPWGEKGWQRCEVGHAVYEKGGRYILITTNLEKTQDKQVTFNPEELGKIMDKI